MPLRAHRLRLARLPSVAFNGFLLSGIVAILLSGCASPGAPVTRQSAKPQKITDLAAKQVGASIVLSFTLPAETTKGQPLESAPEVEIYRTFEKIGATTGPPKKLRLVTKIPAGMTAQYRHGAQFVFPDALQPQELAAHAATDDAIYAVRTRMAKGVSDPSNPFRIPILPAPEPVRDLRAQVSGDSVELLWSAPAILPAGAAEPKTISYQIYRAAASISSSSEKIAGGIGSPPQSDFVLLGESPNASYQDPTAAADQAYRYAVRSVAEFPAGSVQSDESNVVDVTMAGGTRPSAPQRLVATTISNAGSIQISVELSWSIAQQPEITGYNVYRSTTKSEIGARLNTAILLVPVFRDDSVAPGQKYFYRVTAVDRSGRESNPTAPVSVDTGAAP